MNTMVLCVALAVIGALAIGLFVVLYSPYFLSGMISREEEQGENEQEDVSVIRGNGEAA